MKLDISKWEDLQFALTWFKYTFMGCLQKCQSTHSGLEDREDTEFTKSKNTYLGPGRQGGCWITQELQYIFRARKAWRILDHTRITIHIQGQEGREDAGSHENYNTYLGPGRQGGCWITQELQYIFRARKAWRILDHTRITIHIQGQKAGRMLDHKNNNLDNTRITIHIQGQEGRKDAGSHKNYNTYSGPGRQGGCWITRITIWITQELQYTFRARKAGRMLDHTRITIHIQGQEGREDTGSHKNYNTYLGPGRQGGCWITQELQYIFRARKAWRILDHTRITIHIQGQKAGRMLDHKNNNLDNTRITIHIQGQEGRKDAGSHKNYNTYSGPGRQGGCWITRITIWITQELQYTFRARKAGRMLDHTRITIHIQGQEGREDAGSHKNYNTYSGPEGRENAGSHKNYNTHSGPGWQEGCWITQELQYIFRARMAGRMLDHTRVTIHIQGQDGRKDAGSHKNYNTYSGPGRQRGCWITQELQYIFRARKAGRMLDHTRVTIHI